MANRLQRIVKEIEDMVEEREQVKEQVSELKDRIKEINKGIKQVLKSADTEGYKERVVKVVLERRREDPHELEENDMLLNRYEDELYNRRRIGDNSRGASDHDDGLGI